MAAVRTDATCARILKEETGEVVFEVHAMQQVWVELSGEGSRAHGPGLKMTLLSPQHPRVVHLAAEASAGDREGQDSLQVGCIL